MSGVEQGLLYCIVAIHTTRRRQRLDPSVRPSDDDGWSRRNRHFRSGGSWEEEKKRSLDDGDLQYAVVYTCRGSLLMKRDAVDVGSVCSR